MKAVRDFFESSTRSHFIVRHRAAFDVTLKETMPLFLVFAGFLFAAQVGTYLYRIEGTAPALIWPAVGVAFAGVILEGYRALIPIALAATVNAFLNGAPFIIGIVSVAANTLQPAVALYLLHRVGFDRLLAEAKDMLSLVVAGLFVTMIVPTMNAIAAHLYNDLAGAVRPIYWGTWWVGGALSALVLTPFLIRWIRRPMTKRSTSVVLEAMIALTVLVVVSYFLFLTPMTEVAGLSLAYPLLVTLFWLALRCGPRFMTAALLLMSSISLFGAVYGEHPPSDRTLSERVVMVQVMDLFIAIFFFILVSVEEQRKNAVDRAHAAAQKLQEAFDRIRTADTAKNEFIATLAHELRNPLSPILSSIQLLQLKQSTTEEIDRLLSIMEDRVWVMSRLLEDLLDIGRITQRKLELKKEPTFLPAVFERSVEAVMPIMQKRKQIFKVLSAEPLTLDADPARFEQIIVNLLNNAAKYTPEGGSITLSAFHMERRFILTVEDTGIGIPPEKRQMIFEPFTQIERRHAQGGIGIGLHLTKQLVELHGGEIEALSVDGGPGTKFVLSFPEDIVQRAEPVTETETGPTIQRSEFPGRDTILVVDDNEEAAQSLGRLLEIHGYNTWLSHTGGDALKAAETVRPAAILLDIDLPDLDGYEVAREIRASGLETVLIALTGYGQEEDRLAAKHAGFDHHLTKPVGFADLENVLKLRYS